MSYPIPRAIRRRIKTLLASPWLSFWSSYYAGCGSCLNYHRVTTERFDPDKFRPNLGLAVHQDTFSEQLEFLSRYYNCLDLPTAVALLRQRSLPRRSVIITFDDGYRDNLTVALPILEKYHIPATIYITTGLIDGISDLWWYEQDFILEHLPELRIRWAGKNYYWLLRNVAEKNAASQQLTELFKQLSPARQRQLLEVLRAEYPQRYSYQGEMLSWDEVLELDRHPLITIGAHTRSHAVLSQLTDSELRGELIESKQILEEYLGHEVRHFAYPFGGREHAQEREFRAVQAAGFCSAVITRPGHLQRAHAQYLFALPRIPIDYFDAIPALRWKLSGLEAMLFHNGRRFVADGVG